MNEIAAVESTGQTSPSAFENPSLILFDATRMRALMDFADVMSQSLVTLPKHLHNKPADCLAITLQAMRWRMDPYVVGGKTHIVNGHLGYEAQLVVAVLKNSGSVKGRPHYEYKGDGQQLECRAGFVPAGESSIVWTEWLSISSIKIKNSPLWTVNPKQQFGYLQARNWARLYAPDALLGVYTEDELAVIPAAERYMGSAEEVAPSLPPYQAGDFEKNLPAWSKVVASGKKSASDLLAMLSTKATFSEEQKARILSLKTQPAADAAPADTFVAEMEAAEAKETF